MLRDALRKLVGGGSSTRQNKNDAAAQAMIDKGARRDKRYGHMYGNRYEKKARKKAAKQYGSQGISSSHHHAARPAAAAGPPPAAQKMIEKGAKRDRRYGYMYGNWYEDKARKKAWKKYGGK
ncbi:hypothetical protein LIA77_02177 [Sarocladium implicatum]|nr:hypothetical protein LIA77_02177 [Sarocladium implicatum]